MDAPRRDGGHVWQCNEDDRNWPSNWFTQDWYLASKGYWDELANQGIINPPWTVYGSLCGTPTFPSTRMAQSTSPSNSATTNLVASLFTDPSLARPEATASFVASSFSASPTVPGTVAVSLSTSPTALPSLTATQTATSSVASLSTQAPSNPGVTLWDYQAKGTVVAAAVAIGVGALLWGLWALFRHRLKAVYAPRAWFLPPGSRPPPGTIAATLLPFLHLPPLNDPVSEAQVMVHVGASALGIAALTAVVGVGILFPLSIANVPHLFLTTPQNERGGRLGSLTDLSLLRLLNARDPPDRRLALRAFLVAGDVVNSTSAMGGSRTRLIVMLVLMAALSVCGTLFIVWRTYSKLSAYAIRFEDASEGQSMVFIPAAKAPAWQGLTETGIRRRLMLGPGEEGSVAGVFAIGRFDTIKEMVRERVHVLDVLEEAESLYIKSFQATPGSSKNISPDSNRLLSSRFSDLMGSTSSSGSLTGQLADFNPPGQGGSAFLEVSQRQSVVRRLGKFSVGESVVRDEDGTFVPVNEPKPPKNLAPGKRPSPEGLTPAERSAKDLLAALEDSQKRESYMTLASDLTSPHTTTGYQPLASRPQSALDPSMLADLKAKITWSRTRLRKLNANIDKAQQEAMYEVAIGEGATVGWIIVGRGVTSLPCARQLRGRTKEDILWDNLAEPASHRDFWTNIAGVCGVISVIFIPFMCLAVASAPGFAHYLRFLEKLARSDSFGTGVVESLVPAVAIILILFTGIAIVQHLATQTRAASYSDLRLLSVKGVTYLLLVVGTVWVIALGAILYGMDAYAENTHKASSVGDGIMFIAWQGVVLVIILSIILPGIAIIQPRRLINWVVKRRNVVTPRQLFHINKPPNYNPAIGLAPLLTGMFYHLALCGVFPLISVPAVLLAYLALVSHQWLTTRVLCETGGGMSDGSAALWVVRRLGWSVGLQPFVFGLVLLSRREWALGGVGVGIAAIAVVASELVTVATYRRQPPVCFSDVSLTDDSGASDQEREPTLHRRVESDHSALARFHVLLPGLGRLPPENPLPFPTDAIDDYVSTDRAMQARPDASVTDAFATRDTSVVVTPPADVSRGLIYPPELLVPAPTVWLPCGDANVGQQEADALAVEGLTAAVDPQPASLAPGAPVGPSP
ncbi:hypothetical protein CcaverHIS631_0111630 [Cutaneotrichosporon cavernicola]|nr:hypothetical protein CcaverHIS631_0111630 [Cutaneotrichosporon cavernicola]BEJ03985.1 hypothetical protein CcaverHIS641_0111600 [Cutaneotrichosporon cavernicola]